MATSGRIDNQQGRFSFSDVVGFCCRSVFEDRIGSLLSDKNDFEKVSDLASFLEEQRERDQCLPNRDCPGRIACHCGCNDFPKWPQLEFQV